MRDLCLKKLGLQNTQKPAQQNPWGHSPPVAPQPPGTAASASQYGHLETSYGGAALAIACLYLLSRPAVRSGGNYVRLNMKQKRYVRGPALRGRLLRKQVRSRQPLPSSLPPFAM